MVQACFLLESSFVALTAIVVGTALGLAVAYNVISDTRRQPSWSGMPFDVPWLTLALIFVAVYGVAMLTTLAPAARLAGLPGRGAALRMTSAAIALPPTVGWLRCPLQRERGSLASGAPAEPNPARQLDLDLQPRPGHARPQLA